VNKGLGNVNNRSLSVIIPVFNNFESIDELNISLISSLEKLIDIKSEIIYVDDGSSDESLVRLEELKINNRIETKIIQLAGNFGQLNAILAGVEYAENDLIATISADLQDPPEIIARMHEELGQKGRIAVAERESRGDSVFMAIASRITYRIMRIQNKKIPKGGFDCWMLDSKIAEYVLNRSRLSSLIQMNFFNSGNEVHTITYKRRERAHGKSGYKFSKKLQMFIEVFAMSLGKLASYLVILGFAIALSSLLLFSVILYSYSQSTTPFQGFTLIVGLITLFGSFLMIAIGAVLVLTLRQSEAQTNQSHYVIEKIT
jgi:glycosyltransferase involved in cell wall biosynthesis